MQRLDDRITPATFYVSPPLSVSTDSVDLRSAVTTANGNADTLNTIYMTAGVYSLTAGDLSITKNLILERDPSDMIGTSIVVEDDSGTTDHIFDISSGVTLTAYDSVDMRFDGAITGGGSIKKDGSGVLLLNEETGTSTYSGGTNIVDGRVLVGDDADLGSSLGTVTGGGLLDYTGTTTTHRDFSMDGGTIMVESPQTVTFDDDVVAGGASPGHLAGPGTFETDATNGAEFADLHIDSGATVISNNAGDIFLNVSNYGTIDVTAGVNSGGTSTTVNFDGFFSGSTGDMTIGANARVNVADFESDGHLTLDAGTGSGGLFTVLTNLGTSDLTFAGGGTNHTVISDTTQSGLGNYYAAVIDLHGHNASVSNGVAAGYRGLFKNEGAIIDTVSGTGHVIADFGYVEGGGYFQSSVVTMNNGVFQSGDCPGTTTYGDLALGAAGVSNYQFQIDNATGTAGPSPDASGHVDGWSLAHTENLAWTADADHKLTVNLQTLASSTTVGNDVSGTMDNFDPTQSYRWAAVQWTGTYSGPTDVAALNSSTTFDTIAFQNSFHGTFAWDLDTGAGTLYLTYTPAA